MKYPLLSLGQLTKIRTGKLDANAANENGAYPFFTCAVKPLLINTAAFDCKAILVAGNGDLNVKYYEGKFNAYQRTYVIECLDESKLFPKYLYLYLDKYVAKLREQAIGGVIKYIKLENLSDAKIPLLPLADQKRIATILDKAAEIKAKREQAIAKLDELAQGTFINIFGNPFAAKTEVVALGEVAEIIMGQSPVGTSYNREGIGAPLINGPTEYGETYPTAQQWTTKPTKFCEVGDILFCVRGATAGKLNLSNDRYCIGRGVAALRAKKDACINNEFLHALLAQYYSYFQQKGTGSTFINISKDDLFELPIPRATKEKAVFFKTFVDRYVDLKNNLKNSLRIDANLMASLQHQGFTKGFNA
jgi:type I restriction enzyme S subunit